MTGASGFIGRYVLDELNAAGIETITFGRNVPDNATSAKQHIQCDLLRDPCWKDLLAQAKGTHLLHCAWYAEHGKFWTSSENNRWVDASVKLAEAFCQQGGQRIVMVGTCAEYDWEYGWCSEASTPLNGATLYGCAKDATRRLTGCLCRQNKVDFAWGRVFSPFGYGENEQRLIPALIRALRGEIPPMGINSDVYRDFLHASDVARGLVALLQSHAHGAYNISSGQPTSLADLATMLAQLLDVDVSLVLSMPPGRRDNVPLLVGNNRRLLDLGWQPAMNLHAALERTLAEGFK
ncbi:MAG: NAD(P)-dependent oxidoreductase [Rhodoferax sp.]|nr:NAD(P)-dependent oxidoreductase [Rhodoferax sp.]